MKTKAFIFAAFMSLVSLALGQEDIFKPRFLLDSVGTAQDSVVVLQSGGSNGTKQAVEIPWATFVSLMDGGDSVTNQAETVAGGAVSFTSSSSITHLILTSEGGSGVDQLTTLSVTDVAQGDLFFISAETGSTVTLPDGATFDNRGKDVTIAAELDTAIYRYSSQSGVFVLVSEGRPKVESGVLLTTEAGVRTFYTPAEGTDAARGDALEASVAAHTAGDTILVGPGVYQVDYSLVLKAGTSLAGAGRYATTIKQSWLGSAVGDPSIRAHSLIINEGFNTAVGYAAAGNIECRDFTVEARSSGIGFGHAENVRIHNVHCSQMAEGTENGHFFDICGVKNFLAEGLTFKGDSNGFGVYQVDSAEINTALQALDTDGTTELLVNVDNTPCEQVRFVGCQSEITGGVNPDNGVHYALHRDNHRGILISGCQMVGGRFALDTDDGVSGVSDVTFIGNQFTSTDATALKPPIRIRSAPTDAGPPATTRMLSVNISNNIIEYGGSYGLFFRRVDDLTVVGNTLRSTVAAAAYGALIYGCRGTVTGNTVVSTNDPFVVGSAAFFIDEAPTDLTSNQLIISSNTLVNWARGLENYDAAANLIFDPNAFENVGVEVRTDAGNPEMVGRVLTNSNFGPAGSEELISGGVLTVTKSYVQAGAESATSDTVDTITWAGASDGQLLVVYPTSGDTITFSNGTGNLVLDANVILDAVSDRLVLQFNGTNWVQWFGSVGGGVADLTDANFGTATATPLSGDAFTRTSSVHILDHEGPGPTDTLSTINGGSEGDFLWITRASGADLTVDNGGGNIDLGVVGDGLLDEDGEWMCLRHNGTGWDLLYASPNTITVDTDVVNDTTPQLGGPLDTNLQSITSAAGADILIDPDTTGNVWLGNFEFDADQTVGVGQDNYVLTYDNATGHISLEAAAGGGGTGNVAMDSTVADDTNSDSIYISGINAGETLVKGDVVYRKTADGLWWKADNDVDVETGNAWGVAAADVTVGNPVNIMVRGIIRDSTKYTFSAGGVTVYVGATPGALTETAPSAAGSIVKVVGKSLSTSALYVDVTSHWVQLGALGQEETLVFVLSDMTTNLTTGDGKHYDRLPFAFEVSSVRASVHEAPATTNIIVDIETDAADNGTWASIFTTNLLNIDAGDRTSVGSATTPNITTTTLTDDMPIRFNVDQVGTGTTGKGLVVRLKGNRIP